MNTKHKQTTQNDGPAITPAEAKIIELLEMLVQSVADLSNDFAQFKDDHDPDLKKYRAESFSGIAPILKRGGKNG